MIPHKILKSNKEYFKYQRKILKKDARFINYFTNKIIYPVDVYLILISNNDGPNDFYGKFFKVFRKFMTSKH